MPVPLGPVLMGKAFDATGSYGALLPMLAAATGVAALGLNLLPRYETGKTHTGMNACATRSFTNPEKN